MQSTPDTPIGEVPLTPTMVDSPAVTRYPDVRVVGTPIPLCNRSFVAKAIEILLRYHDALRLRREMTPDGEVRFHIPETSATIPFRICNLAQVAKSERSARIAEETVCERSGMLTSGDLVRFVLFESDRFSPAMLVSLLEHSVWDTYSLRILSEDFQKIYGALATSQEPALPQRSTSFREWAVRMKEYADGRSRHSEIFASDVAYWNRLPWDEAVARPYFGQRQPDPASEGAYLIKVTGVRTVQRHLYRKLRANMQDMIFAAFALAFSKETCNQTFGANIVNNARDCSWLGMDMLDTVGRMTVDVPVIIRLGEEEGLEGAIEKTARCRESLPNQGSTFEWLMLSDALRSDVREHVAKLPLLLNYMSVDSEIPKGGNDATRREDAIETATSANRNDVREQASRVMWQTYAIASITGDDLYISWQYYHYRTALQAIGIEPLARRLSLILRQYADQVAALS